MNLFICLDIHIYICLDIDLYNCLHFSFHIDVYIRLELDMDIEFLRSYPQFSLHSCLLSPRAQHGSLQLSPHFSLHLSLHSPQAEHGSLQSSPHLSITSPRHGFLQSPPVFLIVAIWRVSGGLGLYCGGKNNLGRVIFNYLDENSWKIILD